MFITYTLITILMLICVTFMIKFATSKSPLASLALLAGNAFSIFAMCSVYCKDIFILVLLILYIGAIVVMFLFFVLITGTGPELAGSSLRSASSDTANRVGLRHVVALLISLLFFSVFFIVSDVITLFVSSLGLIKPVCLDFNNFLQVTSAEDFLSTTWSNKSFFFDIEIRGLSYGRLSDWASYDFFFDISFVAACALVLFITTIGVIQLLVSTKK